jgi:small subunit ribosomal protein S17
MAKTIIGTVSSAKGDKTIVVTVNTRMTHALYHKQYTVSKKFMAHDAENEAQVGDKVEITETRPISARKHHQLSKILEKPLLREDSLSLTKADDKAVQPATKSKVAAPEEVES